MEHHHCYKYRAGSRRISILQFGLIAICGGCLGVIAGATVYLTIVSHGDSEAARRKTAAITSAFRIHMPAANTSKILEYLWETLAIDGVLLVLQLTAAVKLFKASTPGAEPKAALRQARFWTVTTVVVLYLAYYAIRLSREYVIALGVAHGPLLIVVWKFTKELKLTAAASDDNKRK